MTREQLLEKWSKPVPVLHGQGFVRVVDVMGDDGAIVEDTRVTTGGGRSKHEWGPVKEGNAPTAPGGVYAGALDYHHVCKVCRIEVGCDGAGTSNVLHNPVCEEGDRRLLHYMMEHRHTSPFEMVEAKFHIFIPMDAWRQWIRHRTANVQEHSTRYSPAVDQMLTTPPDAWRLQSKDNRQGSAGTVLEWPEGWRVDDIGGEVSVRSPEQYASADAIDGLGTFLPSPATPGDYLSAREAALHAHAREVYNERIDFGVALEQARKDLPLANFTQARWKMDLHNLLHFLGLRVDGHAQKEIREYAEVIQTFVSEWCPLAFEAWVEHRRDAVTFSATEAEILREYVRELRDVTGRTLRGYDMGLSSRQRASFRKKLGLEES